MHCERAVRIATRAARVTVQLWPCPCRDPRLGQTTRDLARGCIVRMQRCAPSSCMAQPSLTHLRRSVCEEGERRKMKDVTIERGAGRIGTGKARHRASGLHTTARTHQRARGGEGKRLAGRSAQLKSLSFLGFWTVSGSASPVVYASWRALTYLLTYRRTDMYSSPAFSARSTARRSAGPGRIADREGRVRGHAARRVGHEA